MANQVHALGRMGMTMQKYTHWDLRKVTHSSTEKQSLGPALRVSQNYLRIGQSLPMPQNILEWYVKGLDRREEIENFKKTMLKFIWNYKDPE